MILPGRLALSRTAHSSAVANSSCTKARRWCPHRGLESGSILGCSRRGESRRRGRLLLSFPHPYSILFFLVSFCFVEWSSSGEMYTRLKAEHRDARLPVCSLRTVIRDKAKDSGGARRGGGEGDVFELLPSGPPRKTQFHYLLAIKRKRKISQHIKLSLINYCRRICIPRVEI